MSKTVAPAASETAFNCPHCGALTSQTWHQLHSVRLSEPSRVPYFPSPDDQAEMLADEELDEESRERFAKYLKRLQSGAPFITADKRNVFADGEIGNVHLSECYNCRGVAIWVHDRLVYPEIAPSILPNDDLSEDVKADFIEARSILSVSPRGAAALLRLAVQKLCVQLGEPGKHIDTDIASLVKKGLSPKIQRALDIVRVVGNESVHPGEIDVRDDVETAAKLLTLVNLVAEQMITHPREVDSLYEMLPQSKRDAIDRRDMAKPAK
ncbi:DUF4145 domain-containing protein [Burkholderia pseudomultivorans]|uniref:DUF4145 domain-containing protein n=1 Tax=Burkholderia pseudomultivorans TaxID=1207504 RepID=A0A132EUU6_9BURK|nr:DUF4145 domain-containing protein [Burkholderia pseudomultivorans]KWF60029.1 hypothetical protein WT57_29080 [Burkholderia pseudomultivorans]